MPTLNSETMVYTLPDLAHLCCVLLGVYSDARWPCHPLVVHRGLVRHSVTSQLKVGGLLLFCFKTYREISAGFFLSRWSLLFCTGLDCSSNSSFRTGHLWRFRGFEREGSLLSCSLQGARLLLEAVNIPESRAAPCFDRFPVSTGSQPWQARNIGHSPASRFCNIVLTGSKTSTHQDIAAGQAPYSSTPCATYVVQSGTVEQSPQHMAVSSRVRSVWQCRGFGGWGGLQLHSKYTRGGCSLKHGGELAPIATVKKGALSS